LGVGYVPLSQTAIYAVGIEIMRITQKSGKSPTMALEVADMLMSPVTLWAIVVVTKALIEGVKASPTMDRTNIEISPAMFFF